MIQGISLFVVLLGARALTIIGHEAGFITGVEPILHGVLEDALIATSLAFLDAVFRRPRFTWTIYAALALLAAFDVPVARSLGTPMTPLMLRGARVALVDSILTHATPDAVLRLLSVLVLAATVPFAIARSFAELGDDRRRRLLTAGASLAACLLAMLVAPGAAPPFHRNAVIALAPQLPVVDALAPAQARASSAERGVDLSELAGAARGRNVLFVVLESTGALPLGLYGAPGADPMPRLTALARTGLVFDAAYSTFPESIRSQVAYWDSRHPGVGEMPEELATPRAEPLPRLVRRAGYSTALVHSGHFDYLGMEQVVEGRGFEHLVDAGDVGGASATSFGIDEESAVAHVLAWIDAQRDDVPWFAAYLPIAGHHPYDTPRPGPFSGTTAESQYRNALRYADDALGLLLDGMTERGVLDETLIVITGDHGEAFGEHPGNHGHTFHLYEENVRVPMAVALPGRELASRVARVVSHVDLAPTIVELLGLPAARGWEGVSLLDPSPRAALFATDWADRLVGLRDGRHKAILSLETGDLQVFDLVADPDEQNDLADSLPELCERLRARLTPSR